MPAGVAQHIEEKERGAVEDLGELVPVRRGDEHGVEGGESKDVLESDEAVDLGKHVEGTELGGEVPVVGGHATAESTLIREPTVVTRKLDRDLGDRANGPHRLVSAAWGWRRRQRETASGETGGNVGHFR